MVIALPNGQVNSVVRSRPDARTPQLYVDLVDTDGNKLTMTAPLLLEEKLRGVLLKTGYITIDATGRLWQGEKGSRQTLGMRDIMWQEKPPTK